MIIQDLITVVQLTTDVLNEPLSSIPDAPLIIQQFLVLGEPRRHLVGKFLLFFFFTFQIMILGDFIFI